MPIIKHCLRRHLNNGNLESWGWVSTGSTEEKVKMAIQLSNISLFI